MSRVTIRGPWGRKKATSTPSVDHGKTETTISGRLWISQPSSFPLFPLGSPPFERRVFFDLTAPEGGIHHLQALGWWCHYPRHPVELKPLGDPVEASPEAAECRLQERITCVAWPLAFNSSFVMMSFSFGRTPLLSLVFKDTGKKSQAFGHPKLNKY